LQTGASGIEEAGSACTARGTEATSTGKRTVAAIDDAPPPDRARCRRGARGGGGLDVEQSVSGSVPMGDPSTVAFVPKSISSRKETTSQKRKQAHIFGKLGKVGKGWPRTRLRPARRRDTMLPL
jgi:hypothetical protein